MVITIKDFPARLEGFLREKLGLAAKLGEIRHLAGGASRDTWEVDVIVEGGPQAGHQRLVLRRDLGGEIDDRALSREQEFHILEMAHRAGIKVPRPRWLCSDPGVLGAPFFLMDCLEGESVGRRVVRDPALSRARAALPAQLGEQLAKIHALDAANLDFLPRPSLGQSPVLEAVEQAERRLWALGEPHPALELALRWLRARELACEMLVVIHGDFRVGNFMVGPEGLVGVFDWEFCHLGDPAEDLAWPCVRSWRFGRDDLPLGGIGQPEEFLATYERARGVSVSRQRLRYWEVLGNLRWAVGCMTQAQRHLSGQTRSVEFASLGRRTAEVELDLLNLLQEAG